MTGKPSATIGLTAGLCFHCHREPALVIASEAKEAVRQIGERLATDYHGDMTCAEVTGIPVCMVATAALDISPSGWQYPVIPNIR